MTNENECSGLAALAICESLLLALSDQKLLDKAEIMGVLRDAAATHEKAEGSEADVETHRAVAALINTLVKVGGSSWPR